MNKTFRSKIDLLLLIPILIVFITAEILMIINGLFIGAIAVALAGGFIAYLFSDTTYVVTDDNKLRIKSGFLFEREIYIKSIKKIKPVHNHRASPALSKDRLEIRYNRYGRILISPGHRTAFIKELKDVNPRISVEENKYS